MEVESILNDDYESANRYKTAQDIISRALRDSQMRSDTSNWIGSLDSRIESLNQKISDLQSDWGSRIADYDSIVATRRSMMLSRQAEELSLFQKECESPEFEMKFNKASPQLLHLRQIQRQQALTKDFAGALGTKAAADEMQRCEEAESQARAMTWIRSEYKRITDRQKRDLDLATETWTKHRKNFEERRDREIAVTKLVIGQLEIRKKLARPPLSAITRSSQIVTTPRTRQILFAFKSTKDQSRLSLPGRNLGECVNPHRGPQQPWRPRTTKRYRGYV
jgi:hypothetical protein